MVDLGPIRELDTVLESVGRFHIGTSPIHSAACQIARLLEEAHIDYAIAGALCLGAHGVVRATEVVDILITRDGLARFKAEWLGRGYVDLRPGGKVIRDTVNSVKIDFLIAGDFAGDGKPKPVAFPDPAIVAVPSGDLRIVALPRFIELKVASGMTAAHRLQDLADVLKLIETRKLGLDLTRDLDDSVRSKYAELWHDAQHPEDEY